MTSNDVDFFSFQFISPKLARVINLRNVKQEAFLYLTCNGPTSVATGAYNNQQGEQKWIYISPTSNFPL